MMQGFESVEQELDSKRRQLEQELNAVRGRAAEIEADLERVHEALGALTGHKKKAKGRSRSRTCSDRSSLMSTSSGTSLGWPALPTVGRSITPGTTSGAVTMKITSRTSITSTYGTTLISLIGPRLECSRGISRMRRSVAFTASPSAAAGCSRTPP